MFCMDADLYSCSTNRSAYVSVLVASPHALYQPDLDRDSGKWNLNPEQTQKRRELFYELLTYDSWQVGWPSSFPNTGFIGLLGIGHILDFSLTCLYVSEFDIWAASFIFFGPY